MSEPSFSLRMGAPHAAALRVCLLGMEWNERIDLLAVLTKGICTECGKDIPEGDRCHCTNDE